MIKTTDMYKVFTTEEMETTALNAISLSIEEGEFVAVMGPSGCGKSTLLNVLGLLDTPTKGSYKFKGDEVGSYSERQRANYRKSHIGFIFQSFNLIDELTVFENVELPLVYQGLRAAERKPKAEALLDQMEILSRRNHFPQQLSGGEQQRAAVARALVNQPDVILADEPTGNLDSSRGEEVMALLKALNANGTTIVMVTHSPSYADQAGRVVHLFDGSIVNGTTNGDGKFHV